MWTSALETIRCPKCRGSLALHTSESHPSEWIEAGVLACDRCEWLYPIHDGVPILLTYPTRRAKASLENWPAGALEEWGLSNHSPPSGVPPTGEEFVAASFSTEWEAYEYGEDLWIASIEDRLRTFRGECGLSENELTGKKYCEIGCGLGITTHEASAGLGAEAWGVDLSAAVFRAAQHFRGEPRLNFVQASVFALPFVDNSFDFLYSHGVLHHTSSTRLAVEAASRLVGPGGAMYVWLYGYDDVRINWVRRFAFHLENLVRPWIARSPSWLATLLLVPTIPAYQFASWRGIRAGTHAHVYTVEQALHAARDRFTPLFAHRHEVEEVETWFRELGFHRIERVTGDDVSQNWDLAMDRNVAVRGHRA